MFIIYSAQGKQNISVARLRADSMKMAKSKADDAIGESGFEQEFIAAKEYTPVERSPLNNEAIKQYQDNNTVFAERGKLVVVAEDIMSRNVITIKDGDSVYKAWSLMQEFNINHLPVYSENNLLVGLLSSGDILKKLVVTNDSKLNSDSTKKVQDLMNSKVFSTHAKVDIRGIALVMSEYEVGSVLILNSFEDLIGIVSSRDLVRRLAKDPPVTLYV